MMVPGSHFDDLPGWEFRVNERSAGVYEVVAKHEGGMTILRVGTDPDSLIEECKREASGLRSA